MTREFDTLYLLIIAFAFLRKNSSSQRIQERDMGKYTHGQTAYLNANKNRTEVVTEHAHTYRNTCNTLKWFVVQREIVGSVRWVVDLKIKGDD